MNSDLEGQLAGTAYPANLIEDKQHLMSLNLSLSDKIRSALVVFMISIFSFYQIFPHVFLSVLEQLM